MLVRCGWRRRGWLVVSVFGPVMVIVEMGCDVSQGSMAGGGIVRA